MNPYDLIPADIDRKTVTDVTLRERYWPDPETRKPIKGKVLRIQHNDLSATYVPLVFDDEDQAWVEDDRVGSSRWTPRAKVIELGEGTERAAIIKTYMKRMGGYHG